MKPKASAEGENPPAPQPVQKRLVMKSSSFVPQEIEKRKQSGVILEPQSKSTSAPQPQQPIFPPLINSSQITNKAEFDLTISYINQLKNKATREEAFKQLNNRRDFEPNLSVLLWHSTGTIALLLQEIISIYPCITNMTLNQNWSERICNVLGLFQCIALDPRTRMLFLKGLLSSQPSSLRLPDHQHFEQATALRASTSNQSGSHRSARKGRRRGRIDQVHRKNRAHCALPSNHEEGV